MYTKYHCMYYYYYDVFNSKLKKAMFANINKQYKIIFIVFVAMWVCLYKLYFGSFTYS